MKDELLSLAYKRWKMRQVLFGLPPLRIEKLTKLARRSDYCSWSPDEVVLHIKNSEEAFSLAESLPYLGECSKILVRTLAPSFSLRILELSEGEFFYYIQLQDLQRERLASFYALKALSLGYNALLFRSKSKHLVQSYYASFVCEISLRARMYCVKFGIDISDFSKDSRHDLEYVLSNAHVDFFFHEHVENLFCDNDSLLPQEALLEGVIWLRTIVQEHVIIIVQSSPKIIWSESSLIYLLSIFPEHAFLAFDAYLPIASTQEHPIWNLLQQDLIGGNLPIMPIFQGGSSPYGQGIWPIFPGLHWDPLIRLAKQLKFPAICAFSDYFPIGDGFLTCALWCLGQSLWTDWPLFSLYSYWLRLHFPEWDMPIDYAQLTIYLARMVMMPLCNQKIEKKWIFITIQKVQKQRVEDLKLQVYLSSFIKDVYFLVHMQVSSEEKKDRLVKHKKETLDRISPFSTYAIILSENGFRF